MNMYLSSDAVSLSADISVEIAEKPVFTGDLASGNLTHFKISTFKHIFLRVKSHIPAFFTYNPLFSKNTV